MSTDTRIYAAAQFSGLDLRLDTLLQAVGEEVAQQFFWKAETDTIQTYEHRLTCRYVHIDSLTGQFYSQQRVPISRERALDHALPRFNSSPWQTVWVRVLLEPDLCPYVRSFRGEEEPGRLPAAAKRLKGACARVSQRFRARALTMRTYAASASSPMLNQTSETQMNLQGNDLSVANFTRRVA